MVDYVLGDNVDCDEKSEFCDEFVRVGLGNLYSPIPTVAGELYKGEVKAWHNDDCP